MTPIPLTECCMMLGIDPKTLRHWLKQANIAFILHPTDARLKCLTLQQVQHLATLHARPLPACAAPSSDFSGPPPTPHFAHARMQIEPHPLEQGPLPSFPSPVREADLSKHFASLEAKIALLQEQVTQLALALLSERSLRAEQRVMSLQTLVQQASSSPLGKEASQETGASDPVSAPVAAPRGPHPAELRARARLLPLIEYAASGNYVIICPQEGELTFPPDSAEWFDWLATLSSFRFVGQQGRFTASRKSHAGRPTRSWEAVRSFRNHNYKHHLGVTDRLTLAWLEQAAAKLQSYRTAL